MNSPFFTADNLSTGYGKKLILENICFSLEKGTITGLLGANGSGKSTLLRALCQQLSYQGCCRFMGRSLNTLSQRNLAKIISYIPQRSGISLSLSLTDVVLMGFNPRLRLLERPAAKEQNAARQALAAVGLAGREKEDYLSLSEGQKQLCILARTIVENTPLLFLDEPDSALDFHNKYRILQTLQGLVLGQEKAAFICLHDPGLALDFCDQLLLLKEGRCIASLHPAADSPAQMQSAFSEIYGPVSLISCEDGKGRRRWILLSDI